MPRKTLALVSGLVLVTVILFVIALQASKPPVQVAPPTINRQQTQMQPLPTSSAHSVLSLSPNPINVAAGGQGSVNVNIETSDNAVTAVQLEIAYDPNVITNVQVNPGPLFPNPVVLINKNSVKTGRYTYAFGITPNNPTIEGMGTVATITFTAAANATGQRAQLALLPTTLVTARGISSSVLKSSSGTVVVVGTSGQGGGGQGLGR